jgi:hypothetical protein
MAEGYFFRLRRAEIDIDPQIVGAYLSATRARSPSKRRVVVTP